MEVGQAGHHDDVARVFSCALICCDWLFEISRWVVGVFTVCTLVLACDSFLHARRLNSAAVVCECLDGGCADALGN